MKALKYERKKYLEKIYIYKYLLEVANCPSRFKSALPKA